jgi:hypothetical protein
MLGADAPENIPAQVSSRIDDIARQIDDLVAQRRDLT